MDLPELLIVRHGETVWNREGRMQGRLDSPLTAAGMAQAEAMGALLAARGVTGQSHVHLSSPQRRARATAGLIAAATGAEIVIAEELREYSVGDWEGLTRDEIAARGEGKGPEEDWLSFYDRAPGGEGLAAAWDRAGRMLARLDRPAVLICHGITSRMLRTRALGRGLDRLGDLPGGQGVIYRLAGGRHEALAP